MVRKIVLVGALTLLRAFVASLEYTETVETTSGPVRGEEIFENGIHYKAFKGIPYAKPPIRELRFKAPLPPDKWRTVRNATKFGSICHQLNVIPHFRINFPLLIQKFFSNSRKMIEIFLRVLQPSEDCLTLNVFTTQLGNKGLKPVLVLIHGGAFLTGDGTDMMHGPDFLIERDIVVVTLNYRLGAFGFLSTNTSDASGNWGLKDQVAALKWVRDNIVQFGGDPKQVTLAGFSAGGVSTNLHLFSPLSKGLFQRAILFSGTVTCPWATIDQQERLSRRLAQILRAPPSVADNPKNRVEFLRQVDGKVLSAKTAVIHNEEIGDGYVPALFPFAPVVEPPGTVDAFLTEDPTKMIVEGRFRKVPLMIGHTDLEGGFAFMGLSHLHGTQDVRKVQTDVCKILPEPLKTAVIKKKSCSKVTRQTSDLYFGGKSFNSSSLSFAYMYGDVFFIHGIYRAQKWHALYGKEESPVYLYYFTYDGERNFLKTLINLKLPGAAHGDDIGYVFDPKMTRMPRLAPTSPGYLVQERMLGFVSNFVKYGNPTPSLSETVPILWEPAYGNDLKTMHIGKNLEMIGVLTNRIAFWDSVYRHYMGTSI